LNEFIQNYKDMTDECHNNYEQLEAEICALNKIRGEVFNKLKGHKDPAFFKDCRTSDWVDQAPGCSATCGGGQKTMTRTITVYPVGGAQCPPVEQVVACNSQKCPIDCKVADWQGWSTCSSECGGGVKDRNRAVLVAPEFGGNACGDTSETEVCNSQSCDKDCELADWTAWGECSKECGGGKAQRARIVEAKQTGSGTCAGIDSNERLQFQACNTMSCAEKFQLPKDTILKCKAEVDIILVLDGSGSIRKKGWIETMKAANNLLEAMQSKDDNSQVGIQIFSGPKWGCDYFKCMGETRRSRWYRRRCAKKPTANQPPTPEACGLKITTQLTADKAAAKTELSKEKFPSRGTYTSGALRNVESMLRLGRPNAQSVVIVTTDGRPMDKKETAKAAKELNKKAKVVWVPVTKYAPMKDIRRWASDEENIIQVDQFSKLAVADTINKILATGCPELSKD